MLTDLTSYILSLRVHAYKVYTNSANSHILIIGRSGSIRHIGELKRFRHWGYGFICYNVADNNS